MAGTVLQTQTITQFAKCGPAPQSNYLCAAPPHNPIVYVRAHRKIQLTRKARPHVREIDIHAYPSMAMVASGMPGSAVSLLSLSFKTAEAILKRLNIEILENIADILILLCQVLQSFANKILKYGFKEQVR